MDQEYCMYCKKPLIKEKKFHLSCHNEIIYHNAPEMFKDTIKLCNDNNYGFKLIKTKNGYKLNVKIIIN